MKKYIIGIVLSIGMLVSPMFAQASGLTSAQVQAILSLLSSFGADSATIASVNTALTGVASSTGGGQSFCHNFNNDLTVGSTDKVSDDVSALNKALALSGVDTSGDSSVFDENTASDVISFQAKYGIRQTGYVGSKTRAKLNALYGCHNGQQSSQPVTTNWTTNTITAQNNNPITILNPTTAYPLTEGQDSAITWTREYVNANQTYSVSYDAGSYGKGTIGTFTVAQSNCDASQKCYIKWTPNFASPAVTFYVHDTVSGQTGTSDSIKILQPIQTSTSINVLYPTAGLTFTQGNPITVSWLATSPNANYSVTYRAPSGSGGDVYTAAQAHCDAASKCYLSFTPNVVDSNVTIAVYDTTSGASGTSGSFSIVSSTTMVTQPTVTTQPTTTSIQPNFVITGMEPNATGAVAIVGQAYPGVIGFYTTTEVIASKQISFNIQGLPPGLVADNYITQIGYSNNGYISFKGTPTQTGTFPVTATFTYGNNYNVSKTFYLTVNPAGTVTTGFPQYTQVPTTPSSPTPTPVTCTPSNNSATPVSTTNSVGAITVISPNGGDCLTKGSTATITWTNSNNIDKVTIYYVASSGTAGVIASNIVNTGSYSWNVNVGNTVNTQFKIEILGYQTGIGSVTDYSDNYFTVK